MAGAGGVWRVEGGVRQAEGGVRQAEGGGVRRAGAVDVEKEWCGAAGLARRAGTRNVVENNPRSRRVSLSWAEAVTGPGGVPGGLSGRLRRGTGLRLSTP